MRGQLIVISGFVTTLVAYVLNKEIGTPLGPLGVILSFVLGAIGAWFNTRGD